MKTKHLFPFICIILFVASTCKKPEKEYAIPIIYTLQPLEIKTSKAIFRANITKGLENVSAFGFEWKKTNESEYQIITVQSSNESLSVSITNLKEDTEYVVRAFVVDIFDTLRYGNEIPFFTKGTLIDIDENIYFTLRYGDKVWMTENMRTTRFADGTPIEGRSSGKTSGSDGPLYFFDEFHTPFLSDPNFGLLYNFVAAGKKRDSTIIITNPNLIGVRQGVCPVGWHLPTGSEWGKLFDFCSKYGSLSSAMKTLNFENETNYTVNNYSQFSVEPAGCYFGDSFFGNFRGLFGSAYLWSSNGFAFLLISEFTRAEFIKMKTYHGCSVRCVKD